MGSLRAGQILRMGMRRLCLSIAVCVTTPFVLVACPLDNRVFYMKVDSTSLEGSVPLSADAGIFSPDSGVLVEASLDGSTDAPAHRDAHRPTGAGGADSSSTSCSPTCAVGSPCASQYDCESGVCEGGACSAPSCTDHVKNGTETEADCGGTCSPCAPGQGCQSASDCTTGICRNFVCDTPTCVDGEKNGTETGRDCGGGCRPCISGEGCNDGSDCQSGICAGSLCAGTGATALSAGAYHTCAVLPSGGVDCWGFNAYGELGNGGAADSHLPVGVVGFSSGVAAVSAGAHHTCVLAASGGVQCWGDNTYGQLGDGTKSGSTVAVAVRDLPATVTSISAGTYHNCAVAPGLLKCWGENAHGQLGDGSLQDRSTPVAVLGLASTVVAVAVGWHHTCALTSAGGVQCWGGNLHGQLGNETFTDSGAPVSVKGLSTGVLAVAAGTEHTCALTAAGAVQCWGHNDHGQLGDGTYTDSAAPVQVTGLTSGVSAVSAGWYNTCVIVSGGGVQCWGDNTRGQLGSDVEAGSQTPTAVAGVGSASGVTTGADHTCALLSQGVKCWGYNASGQLGNNASSFGNELPVSVLGL